MVLLQGLPLLIYSQVGTLGNVRYVKAELLIGTRYIAGAIASRAVHVS